MVFRFGVNNWGSKNSIKLSSSPNRLPTRHSLVLAFPKQTILYSSKIKFKPRQLYLAVGMVTDYVYNLKAVL
ncbi:Uncharacterised protein [Streptococcus pneumoniae]|nr:Uncharacterised protein [Streptococcus pneumoniae]